jgi:hypothetical protein
MKTLLILCTVILAGCASQTSKHLPSIECRGKGTITGTGNVSVMMGSASNNFTIQADCGQDGFVFRQPAEAPK